MDTSRTPKPERARRPAAPVQPAGASGAAPGPAPPRGLEPAALLGLQQAIGNQAVQRLLARDAARRAAHPQRGPPGAGRPAPRPAGPAAPALMREEQPADEPPEHEAEGAPYFEGVDDDAQWRQDEAAARQREAEEQAFLAGFEVQARVNVINLLMGSEALVHAERRRYGIPVPAVEADTMAAPEPKRQVAAGGENEGLAAAAAELAAAAERARALYPAPPAEERPAYDEEGFYEGVGAGATGAGPAPGAAEPPPDPEALEDAIAQAEQDYAVLRAERVAAYPILAMYAPADLAAPVHADLSALARGPSPAATALLAVDVAERLRNITTTRTAVAAGTLDVWSLPRVVAITQKQFAAADGTRHAELIRRRVADAEWDDVLGDVALGVLALALGLAAIGTGMGGAPLAAAAFTALAGGVNAVLTAEHFQDYLLESAAAGTDFDKARAIAAGAPSLFWLAVDIVATILDVKAATDVFRRLLPLAEAAVAAVPAARAAAAQFGDAVGDVADETPALHALREAGNDEMPGLGDTLVESALRAEQRAAARAAGDAPLVPDAALAFGAGRALPRPRKANCVYRIMSNAEAAEALEHGRLPAATGGSEPSKYLSLDSDYSALFPQKRLDAARKAGARGEAAKAQDLIEDWHQAPGQTMLLEIELQPGALDEILRRAVTEDAIRTYRGADVFIYKLERGAHNIAVPSWQRDTFNAWVKAVRVQGWRAPLGPVKGAAGAN